MLKKIFFSVLLLFPLTLLAQVQFGYLSYSKIYKAMPEYTAAQNSMKELEDKYNSEVKHSEDEFNRKYAEFYQGQKDFPQYILEKRQKELQELMEKSIDFKEKAKQLLRDSESKLKAPIEERLNQAIKSVGEEFGYSYILNTDNNTYPFINANAGVDITATVMNRLGIKHE